MKIIAIIPARYASTRFPGKPLADICGRPMIWWVHRQVKCVNEFADVFVATDDERIASVCKQFDIHCIMTSNDLPEHISRVHEVSEKVQADFYICVNGDEPLISADCIRAILPKSDSEKYFYSGAVRKLIDPAETIDFANIKVVLTPNGRGIYMSRTPVPYPRGTLLFQYYKYVGIECFTKEGLDFFVTTKQSMIEKIEDIDHLRFIEYGKEIRFTEVESESISVDTPKDLEKVRTIVRLKIDSGEIKL